MRGDEVQFWFQDEKKEKCYTAPVVNVAYKTVYCKSETLFKVKGHKNNNTNQLDFA